MIKMKCILEGLDEPYKFRHTFSTEMVDYEDEETGETYKKEILSPVQMVFFMSDNKIPYLWYARQSKYDDTNWEIAFGIDKGTDRKGAHQLDIGITNTGNAKRIFSTVIAITNSFIEHDENCEIHHLNFTSKLDKRTNFYLKRLLPLIDHFKLKNVTKSGDESIVILQRYD